MQIKRVEYFCGGLFHETGAITFVSPSRGLQETEDFGKGTTGNRGHNLPLEKENL